MSPDPNGINRRTFLQVATAGVAGPAVALGAAQAQGEAAPAGGNEPPVWNVASEKQLFIDNRFIAESQNVALTMNQPDKLGELLTMEGKPWINLGGGYFSVLEDAGIYKMYYGAFGSGLCYAESTDGLHWATPSLGLAGENNVIPGMSLDATIMVDPVDVPERRYKIFWIEWTQEDANVAGIHASYSADGIHFTPAGRVLPVLPETSVIAYWDKRVGRYVVFLRVLARNTENQRQHARLELDDLLAPWPFRGEVPADLRATPEHFDVVLAADDRDNPHSDFYTSAVTIYPHAQDVYLAFPTPFRHFSPADQPWFWAVGERLQKPEDWGLIETQLAVSRDGIKWDRPDRRPYFPMGLPDEWDRWLTMMGVGILRNGSYLHQYYYTTGRLHDSAILRPEYEGLLQTHNSYGALRQRLDGFISADFAYTGGTLLTPPITFSGDRLQLNVDTGAMGWLFVEVRDQANNPIAGFTRADCYEIGGNFVDVTVQWKGSLDVSSLAGRPVRLYFEGRGAKLYAFQFTSAQP